MNISAGGLNNSFASFHKSQTLIIIETLIFIGLDVVAFVGNALICLAFYRNRHLLTTTNVFILSLALTDLFQSLFVMPFSVGASVLQSWIFGHFGCQFMEILGYILAGVSIETLTVIAFNRYLCVARPLLYRRVFTKRRTIIIAAITWTGTASYLGLGIPLSGIEFRPSPTKVVCVPFLKDEKVSLLKLVVLLFYALTFLIASLIIPTCYVKVFLAFRRHNAKVASSLQAPMSIRNSHVNVNDIAFDRKDSLCTVNVNVAFDRRDSVGTVNVNVVSGQQDPIGTGNIALDQQDSVGTVNVNTVGGQQDSIGTGNISLDQQDSVGTVNVNTVGGQQDPIGTGTGYIAFDQQDSVGIVNINTVSGQQDSIRTASVNIAFDQQDSVGSVNGNVVIDQQELISTASGNIAFGHQDLIGTAYCNIDFDQQDCVGTANGNVAFSQIDSVVTVDTNAANIKHGTVDITNESVTGNTIATANIDTCKTSIDHATDVTTADFVANTDNSGYVHNIFDSVDAVDSSNKTVFMHAFTANKSTKSINSPSDFVVNANKEVASDVFVTNSVETVTVTHCVTDRPTTAVVSDEVSCAAKTNNCPNASSIAVAIIDQHRNSVKRVANSVGGIKSSNTPRLKVPRHGAIKEAKMTKILAATVVGFYLCWLPALLYGLLYLFGVFGKDGSSGNLFSNFVYTFPVYMSSTINPLIYVTMNKTFREAFCKLVCCE